MSEARTTPHCRLELLRDPCLHTADGTRYKLSRKDAALLALLALDGAAARDSVARLLWPTQTPARALASLRQRRFRLGRSAGQAVVDGDETLRLAAGVAHDLGDPLPALQADAAALQGDLLQGLDCAGIPDFDAWLLGGRERWRVQRAQALASLASQHEADNALAAALACAERLAGDEPLSDHAHRRLMRLHHLRGDLGAATEVYRRFAARLDAELGELPDDETAELAARLRQGTQAPPRAPVPVPATLRRPPRRVGREAAWQALQQAWEASAALVVQGAPGAGKTRLLADYARLCSPGSVLMLAARPGDAERPYAAASALLDQLWLQPGAPQPQGVAALPAWVRRELAVLLPELGPAPAVADALRLQRALRAALAASGLQLVILDDVQQADRATLEVLPALQGPGLPRWWLGVRQGEQPAPLAAWLQASAAPALVSLAPLEAGDIETLLDDLGLPGVNGPIRGASWAQTLLRRTGGLPLFLLETLRSLHESPGQDLHTLPAPEGAAQVVRARLQRLSEPARQLAHAAAVLDAPLSLGAGAELLGGTPLGWSAAFSALEAAHWVDGQGRLHDLVRAAIEDAMPAAERRWLHGRVAAWHAAQSSPPLVTARHWAAAGRDALAAPLFEAAALVARRSARPQEEAALWDHAIAAHERAGQSRAAFAAWRESLEARLFSVGPVVVQGLTEALLQRAGDERQRLDALLAHAQVKMLQSEVQEVQRLAAEASTLARRLKDPAGRLLAGQLRATALAQTQALGEALQVLDELAGLLPAVPERLHYGYLSARSWVLHRAGRYGECAQALGRVMAMAESAGDWVEACTNSSNMASLLVSLGRFDEALAAVERALALRAQLGPAQGVHIGNVDLNHGYVLMALGRLGSARQAIARADEAFTQSAGAGVWSLAAANALATAEWLAGDTDAAAARLAAPCEGAPAFIDARRWLLRARVARARGQDPQPALQQAQALLGTLGDRGARLAVEAEGLLGAAPAQAAQAAQQLAQLAQQALQAEQGAVGSRLGWLRVQMLLRAGETGDAAAQTLALLAPGVPGPFDLPPAQQWALAAEALAAAGHPQAGAFRARALAAQAAQDADLMRPGAATVR